jgi:hypothetical protein
MHGSNNVSRQQQRRTGDALLIPKPEVKEEQDDETVRKSALLAEYERQQRLIARSDDPEDYLGLHTVFIAERHGCLEGRPRQRDRHVHPRHREATRQPHRRWRG